MGEKLVKLLNCEDKEEGYMDSDEDIDDKLSNTANKTADKTFNIAESNVNPPPPTAKDPPNTQINNFRDGISNKMDFSNQSMIGTLKHDMETAPISEIHLVKKNSMIEIIAKAETIENIQKTNENQEKVQNFIENQGEKPEPDNSAIDLIKENPSNDNGKQNYQDFLMKSPENKEMIGSTSFYLPNQIREEKKTPKDVFIQENSMENDEDFQRFSTSRKKEKCSSNPIENQPDMLFQKTPKKDNELN